MLEGNRECLDVLLTMLLVVTCKPATGTYLHVCVDWMHMPAAVLLFARSAHAQVQIMSDRLCQAASHCCTKHCVKAELDLSELLLLARRILAKSD